MFGDGNTASFENSLLADFGTDQPPPSTTAAAINGQLAAPSIPIVSQIDISLMTPSLASTPASLSRQSLPSQQDLANSITANFPPANLQLSSPSVDRQFSRSSPPLPGPSNQSSQFNPNPSNQPNQPPLNQPNQPPLNQPNQPPLNQPNQLSSNQPNQLPFNQLPASLSNHRPSVVHGQRSNGSYAPVSSSPTTAPSLLSTMSSSTGSGQMWLLRLFQSEFFNTWIAVSYLFKYPEVVGIQHYLCSRLRDEFPVEDVQFLLPQLWSANFCYYVILICL
jgi:hypothetical protein